MFKKRDCLFWFLIFPAILFGNRYLGDIEELGASAKAMGMGSAAVALGNDAAAFYYNPSLSANLKRREVLFLHSENFGGLVKNDFIAFVLPQRKSAVGFSLLINHIPGIKYCSLPNPDSLPSEKNKPQHVRTIYAFDIISYFNYAYSLHPQLLVGANMKFIYRNLGVSSAYGGGLDLGLAVMPMKDLVLGIRIRNLTTSPLLYSHGPQEKIEPRAAIGMTKSFELPKGRASFAFETEKNFSSLEDFVNFGTEYELNQHLALRVGFYHRSITFGIGGNYRNFYLDYAYESAKFPNTRELPTSLLKLSGGVKF